MSPFQVSWRSRSTSLSSLGASGSRSEACRDLVGGCISNALPSKRSVSIPPFFNQPVSPVKSAVTNLQEPFHPCGKIGLWRLDHQMETVAHEAEGVHLPARLLAHLAQHLQETLPILFIAKDRLTPVSPAHHSTPPPSRQLQHPNFCVNGEKRPLFFISTLFFYDPFSSYRHRPHP